MLRRDCCDSAVVCTDLEELAALHAINDTIEYAANDMKTGTSAGGMLACSMLYNHKGQKMDCSKAVELFENGGPIIFKKNGFNKLRRLVDSQYPAKNIENVLKDIFGDSKISDAETEGLITAYDITNREAVLFDTESAKRDKKRDYRLRDIARATSAAPTYFPIAEIFILLSSQYFRNACIS